MSDPAFLEKTKRGPVVLFTMFPPGGVNIAKNLIGWFIYLLVVGFFSAYVARRALKAGSPYLSVFRFVGVTAFLSYAAGPLADDHLVQPKTWVTSIKISRWTA